jgi:3-mercaptopyruvate sulfurtransferase SseA
LSRSIDNPPSGFALYTGANSPCEFFDHATRFCFMMPPVAQFEAAFGRHGIVAGAGVVLYSIGTMMWATRFWWMLKALGFDKWLSEGLTVEHGPAKGYPPAVYRQAEARPVRRQATGARRQPGTSPNSGI